MASHAESAIVHYLGLWTRAQASGLRYREVTPPCGSSLIMKKEYRNTGLLISISKEKSNLVKKGQI